MAITFDTVNKVILLDSFNVSASAIWTAWVDWLVVSDNLKYDIAFSQIGGVAPIALYLYLENGWKVRPQEADGITTITGNLLVQGGGNPITNTIGNWQILINMETPISAQAIEVNTGSGVTAQDKLDIALEVWNNTVRTLTSAGAGGATAQEVWEYSQRELTSTTTSSLTQAQNDQLFSIPTTTGTQSIINNLEAAVSAMIGNPTPQADLVGKLSELDTGIRQVLTNITTEINENQVVIEKGSMRLTI